MLIGVVMFYPCFFCPSDNSGAPEVLMRLGAHTFYYYHTFLDHTTNISRKVGAPRRVSTSGAPNNLQNFHLDKTYMNKTLQPGDRMFQTPTPASRKPPCNSSKILKNCSLCLQLGNAAKK